MRLWPTAITPLTRIDGILEEENEPWDTTEEKVKQVLAEKLNLEEVLHIERAHRVGGVVSGPRRRPCTIVCKLRDFKQKEQILKITRRIKPVGLYLNEDLSKDTLDKREEQRPKLEEAKGECKSSVLCIAQ